MTDKCHFDKLLLTLVAIWQEKCGGLKSELNESRVKKRREIARGGGGGWVDTKKKITSSHRVLQAFRRSKEE